MHEVMKALKYVLNIWLMVIIMLLTQGLNCVYSLMQLPL